MPEEKCSCWLGTKSAKVRPTIESFTSRTGRKIRLSKIDFNVSAKARDSSERPGKHRHVRPRFVSLPTGGRGTGCRTVWGSPAAPVFFGGRFSRLGLSSAPPGFCSRNQGRRGPRKSDIEITDPLIIIDPGAWATEIRTSTDTCPTPSGWYPRDPVTRMSWHPYRLKP